jgi:hypothetical protein
VEAVVDVVGGEAVAPRLLEVPLTQVSEGVEVEKRSAAGELAEWVWKSDRRIGN